jgi:hypothetical protein
MDSSDIQSKGTSNIMETEKLSSLHAPSSPVSVVENEQIPEKEPRQTLFVEMYEEESNSRQEKFEANLEKEISFKSALRENETDDGYKGYSPEEKIEAKEDKKAFCESTMREIVEDKMLGGNSKEQIKSVAIPLKFVEKIRCKIDEMLQKKKSSPKRSEIHEVEDKKRNILDEIAHDFCQGDKKILRAIGRTATVNAVVVVTALTGGTAGAAGFLTGGAITAKRLGNGINNEDGKEIAKSIAVYGSATTASIAGQAVTGAIMLGLAGATLPVAGAVAFGVGCASGLTAGALSEWGVDNALKNNKEETP